jgi:hypothetical protein
MKRFYIDYTNIGGNSFQVGLNGKLNGGGHTTTTYFMTVIWNSEDNPQIIVPSDILLYKECYEELNSILYAIHSEHKKVTKKILSDILVTNGYIKNPLN